MMSASEAAQPRILSVYGKERNPCLSQQGQDRIKVDHTHPSRDEIADRIKSLNLKETLDLIAKVKTDIAKFSPYARDEIGQYSVVWIDAACEATGDDEATLALLKMRLKELGLPQHVNI